MHMTTPTRSSLLTHTLLLLLLLQISPASSQEPSISSARYLTCKTTVTQLRAQLSGLSGEASQLRQEIFEIQRRDVEDNSDAKQREMQNYAEQTEKLQFARDMQHLHREARHEDQRPNAYADVERKMTIENRLAAHADNAALTQEESAAQESAEAAKLQSRAEQIKAKIAELEQQKKALKDKVNHAFVSEASAQRIDGRIREKHDHIELETRELDSERDKLRNSRNSANGNENALRAAITGETDKLAQDKQKLDREEAERQQAEAQKLNARKVEFREMQRIKRDENRIENSKETLSENEQKLEDDEFKARQQKHDLENLRDKESHEFSRLNSDERMLAHQERRYAQGAKLTADAETKAVPQKAIFDLEGQRSELSSLLQTLERQILSTQAKITQDDSRVVDDSTKLADADSNRGMTREELDLQKRRLKTLEGAMVSTQQQARADEEKALSHHAPVESRERAMRKLNMDRIAHQRFESSAIAQQQGVRDVEAQHEDAMRSESRANRKYNDEKMQSARARVELRDLYQRRNKIHDTLRKIENQIADLKQRYRASKQEMARGKDEERDARKGIRVDENRIRRESLEVQRYKQDIRGDEAPLKNAMRGEYKEKQLLHIEQGKLDQDEQLYHKDELALNRAQIANKNSVTRERELIANEAALKSQFASDREAMRLRQRELRRAEQRLADDEKGISKDTTRKEKLETEAEKLNGEGQRERQLAGEEFTAAQKAAADASVVQKHIDELKRELNSIRIRMHESRTSAHIHDRNAVDLHLAAASQPELDLLLAGEQMPQAPSAEQRTSAIPPGDMERVSALRRQAEETERKIAFAQLQLGSALQCVTEYESQVQGVHAIPNTDAL